ncbi:MAG: hypothetical protein U1F65_01320 [Verrucomicrobiota bacterium]
MKPTSKLLCVLTLLPVLLAAPLHADELGDKGRAVFTKNNQAVVTVSIVLKLTYSSGGQSSAQESKQEATGTVIDPSGLTVLALSACDPADMYARMDSRYKVETEVTDLKIMLSDGSELPAEIVLRDKDLDLAFIRPKAKPASPMTAVDVAKSGSAQVLDEVVALNRLNSAASRAYSASVERIAAVVQKPRTFYIPDSTMSATTMGSPAFLINGNFLGVFVMRAVGSGGGRPNLTAIILPAEDIMKGAKQAPEAKGDSDKKEEPKDATGKKEAPEKK